MNEEDMFNTQMETQQKQQDIGFLAAAQDGKDTSSWSKHLDATEILEQIEKLLMGYEYNSEDGSYTEIEVEVQGEDGTTKKVKQGPILEPNYVRMTIGYLRTFLNTNVYLSYLEQLDQVNELMWDVKKKLTTLLHPLKKRYDAKMVEVIGSMIENPIYMALLRAYKKNTLDAMSKSQHSIEHVNPNTMPQQNTQPKKFKIFGF